MYSDIEAWLGLDMPNKTIYVSDDDLPLFERAQELAGSNLSSAIVRALKRYIELEEAGQHGLEEITVIVNTQGAHRQKRFIGQRLVRWVQPAAKAKGTEVMCVYRTAGKRYALHTRYIPNWDFEVGDPDQLSDPNNWGVGKGFLQKVFSWGYDWESFKTSGDYTLQVFDTLEELKSHVSSEVFQANRTIGRRPGNPTMCTSTGSPRPAPLHGPWTSAETWSPRTCVATSGPVLDL